MTLSVIIPCFNERRTIRTIVDKVKAVVAAGTEIIIVDDASTDGTDAIVDELAGEGTVVVHHPDNRGKGAAMETGFRHATGDIVLVQDADLEYDPRDYAELLSPIENGEADVVFGSRFMGGRPHRVVYFWHMVGNRVLTLLSNIFTNLNLSDMETGYKVFRRDVLKDLQIEEKRFGFEPEITAKLAQRRCRFYEVGISYYGRTYEEGKKIGWRDGVRALYVILKYNLWKREAYVFEPASAASALTAIEPPFQFQYRGHDILDLLKGARNYNQWLAAQVIAAKPPGAAKVIDLGAGRGTFAEVLSARGLEVKCVEPDPENQVVLREKGFRVRTGMEEHQPGSCDYVYTLNVLEHVRNDEALVRSGFSRLRVGGRFFVFVPAFPILWSSLDDHVEHQRRYRRAPMLAMLRRAGFVVERARYADCLGFFAALLFGRAARTGITPRNIWFYDRLLFPLSRFLDPIFGRFFGKNLAVLCRKEA